MKNYNVSDEPVTKVAVDIICHGSPSPKLWREYAESIQKKDGRITYLTFKDKRNTKPAIHEYVGTYTRVYADFRKWRVLEGFI